MPTHPSRRTESIAIALCLFGCGSGGADDAATGEGSGSADETSAPPTSGADGDTADTGAGNGGAYAACGGAIFVDGVLDEAEYEAQARMWDRDTIDCRLGPRYADVHASDEPDMRPDLWEPPTMMCGGDGTLVTYEYGPPDCAQDCAQIDFGSTGGQVLYLPDDPNDPGVDRVLTYAYDGAFVAVEPQPATGGAHPDPHLATPGWPALGFADPHAFAVQRNRFGWDNQSLALFRDGFIGALGTRTDGVPAELQVGFAFPEHLAPTAVALSSMSEFAFVTLWDTNEHTGKLAVFAMHGNFPTAHAWWYIGLPNVGGFSGMKLLGYVDLPIATPTSVAAVTNGFRGSPHDTGTQPLGSFALVQDGVCQPDIMAQFDHGGGFSHVVAAHGYVVVASRWEDRVVLVDLEPLLGYFRRAYLEDVDLCNTEVGPVHVWSPNPAPDQFAGDDRWPFSFEVAPESMPVVAASLDIPHPRDVLAGMQWRDTTDVPKAYALGDGGQLFVIAPNRLFSQHPDEPPTSSDDPSVLLEFATCPHPTTMQFLRGSFTVPAADFPGAETDPSINARNGAPLIACRGDRMLQAVATWGDAATVLWELQDQALGDPVGMDLSERGPIVTVADFDGQSLVNYQIGDIVGQGCGTNDYPVMPTGDLAIHRGGVMSLPGPVHQITSSNVN